MKPTTFVITGPPSSGKSTVTKLIGEYAGSQNIPFSSRKFSAPIAEGIEDRGFQIVSRDGANYYVKDNVSFPQRTLMQTYGNELREKKGPQALAKLLLTEKVQNQMKEGIFVFEGCRNIHEYQFINDLCSMINVESVLVGIYADLETCFKRATANKPATFEDFKIQYELEMRENVDEDDIQVRKLLEIAKKEGIYIENNRGVESLKEELFKSLKDFK